MSNQNYYDITVIGGGPVGLFTATYARMHKANVQIIESLAQLGGQANALFPTKKIYDVPGFCSITASTLIDHLTEQTNMFSPDIYLNETVKNITKTPRGFCLKTSKRLTYSHAIIIATGIGSFQPRRLAVTDAYNLEGKQLRYFVQDPNEFSGKDVVIAGGGDSAIDWALELEKKVASLHIVHRRTQFRALEANVASLLQTKTVFNTPYLIDDVKKCGTAKIAIDLKKVRSDEHHVLTADYLLVNYGFISDNKILNSWNLKTDHNLITVTPDMQTSIPGIFAAGDTITYPGRSNLIATGFGEAPIAVNSAMRYVYPDTRQPIHSTQLMKHFLAGKKK
ncbi:NAD(P)/FAD-dependent oxidoreductase [Liquorilactobacillus capillatus]|uniref:Ferredoxin--NADP reductase n=1 Tax=Liquorilactobacillus capillatus DSM 19910 TaxID=1423731 RepID=A0A0R1MEI3_9LACO|nr:NAD(P)/FAD-dependent oxidoreductase [Liquorilactobacillus capillatus]KRL02731.1 thioredoxin reductase [Liquorilactobacillus capillatus DSM 19910]